MVLMPPVRPLRSATKALLHSIANTAASSASLRCGTFERFFPQVLQNSNWSVDPESVVRCLHLYPRASALRSYRTRVYIIRCFERVVSNTEVIQCSFERKTQNTTAAFGIAFDEVQSVVTTAVTPSSSARFERMQRRPIAHDRLRRVTLQHQPQDAVVYLIVHAIRSAEVQPL